MTLPVAVKTWNFTLNNRITYVSLNDLAASYMFGIKAFLKAQGYTTKGSCDGTTGAMDGVDRWASKANCTTRHATTGTQSWYVFTDGNGCDLLITYSGATDDVFGMFFSPSGVYAQAGTPNNQPTATDATNVYVSTTVVGTTTSSDRVWSGQCTSDLKMCRFFIFRAGALVSTWGLEVATPTVVSPAVWSPAVIGWGYASNKMGANMFLAGATGAAGYARPVISSTPVAVINMSPTVETPAGTTPNGINAELQGSTGPLILSMGWWSVTAGARGKLANRIDWYVSYDTQADGALTTDKFWIFIGSTNGASSAVIGSLLPWDGSTTPVTS